MTHGEKTRDNILEAGLALWRGDPASVSARKIASMLGLTHSAIFYHYRTIDLLRDAIAARAVAIGDRVIIPRLIVANHIAVAALSVKERGKWLRSAAG